MSINYLQCESYDIPAVSPYQPPQRMAVAQTIVMIAHCQYLDFYIIDPSYQCLFTFAIRSKVKRCENTVQFIK